MTRKKLDKACSANEKIRLKSFHTSEALKRKIRKITEDYRRKGWDLKKIENCGEFIHLRFGLIRCNEQN